MRYGELFREENEHVAERYRLTIDRLGRIPGENTVDPRFRSYFEKVASFLLFIDRVYGLCESGNVRKMSAGELAELNHSLYEDVLPAHYGESFANPAYAAQRMGAELGPLLSFLYTEIRGGIVYAFESRLTDITILNELFIEVYNLFEEGAGTEDGAPAVKEVQSALYWFVSDYCDVTVP
ncbi:MAG TPA: leucyl aminopeptidase, partial [Candidatus Ventrisoma faecale]|nr:leucyl aminopeptidase [Candidatus Ventrisoma faecale]